MEREKKKQNKKNVYLNAISITFTLFRLSPNLVEVTGDKNKKALDRQEVDYKIILGLSI